MLKEEFEKLIGETVTPEYYGLVDIVYMYHPYIDNVNGKKKIAELHDAGILIDLVARASAIMELEFSISDVKEDLRSLDAEYKSITEKYESDKEAKVMTLNRLKQELKNENKSR